RREEGSCPPRSHCRTVQPAHSDAARIRCSPRPAPQLAPEIHRRRRGHHPGVTMLSPRQIFEDNIRPADLLLKVFRLMEHDAPNTEAALLKSLREIVKAEDEEALIVIYNEIFLGLIRERAEVPPSAIKRSALCNLLRQSVVTACTALETYLPSLLRTQLSEIIHLRGREFVPKDKEIGEQFKNLTFSL